ncbi:MAG TPA: hypothetical protein VFX28_10565, partial [Methylomirabilota bacterium]|nr:hypothetical protein [Methylomirabilota bacterium]
MLKLMLPEEAFWVLFDEADREHSPLSTDARKLVAGGARKESRVGAEVRFTLEVPVHVAEELRACLADAIERYRLEGDRFRELACRV